MTLTIHNMAVRPMLDMLNSIPCWLDKAQDQEAALMDARLAPDMFALPRQIQIVSDTAKGMVARLSGGEAPAMPDTESSFAELKQRCARTISYVQSVDAATIEAGRTREIVITFPNGGGMRFDGQTYVAGFALPNFYFHATAAYAILRAHGIAMGKQDYLAALAPHMFAPPAA